MGLLTALLTLPVSAPVKTAWWVAEKLHEQAIAERDDPATIKAAIAHLEERLLAGEITEDAYEDAELELLTRLREIQSAGAVKGPAQGG